MHCVLPDSYKSFFANHKLLELENLLSPEETLFFLEKTEELFSKGATSPSALWSAGRDLWKRDPSFKKALCKSNLGSIASQLFLQKPLRLSSLWVIYGDDKGPSPLSAPCSLEQISSKSPVLGGVFLCLDTLSSQSEETSLPHLCKQTKGRALFFTGAQELPLPDLFSQNGFKGLLLAFSPQRVLYTHKPLDTHTHELKRSGYTFGDLIPEEEAPYLYY